MPYMPKKDTNGYLALNYTKPTGVKKKSPLLPRFRKEKALLHKITEEHQFCQKVNGLYEPPKRLLSIRFEAMFGRLRRKRSAGRLQQTRN